MTVRPRFDDTTSRQILNENSFYSSVSYDNSSRFNSSNSKCLELEGRIAFCSISRIFRKLWTNKIKSNGLPMLRKRNSVDSVVTMYVLLSRRCWIKKPLQPILIEFVVQSIHIWLLPLILTIMRGRSADGRLRKRLRESDQLSSCWRHNDERTNEQMGDSKRSNRQSNLDGKSQQGIHAVWPDGRIKSSPISSKFAEK